MRAHPPKAAGKLMLNVPGSVAEFERRLMLERQRTGILNANAGACTLLIHIKGDKRRWAILRLADVRQWHLPKL